MSFLTQKLIVAISSRALFNLDAENHIYEEQGVDAYARYQREHEEDILAPGVAFPMLEKLLKIIDPETSQQLAEVVLLSRNSADTGLRIFHSINAYQLPISRAVFTNGINPYAYTQAFGAHLFLSAHPQDVEHALCSHQAAALIMPKEGQAGNQGELRIAFDGDAVLFSDEAERIYQEKGLAAFTENEKLQAKVPLSGGPLKGFLAALYNIQSRFPSNACPIRTALITARAAPAHERAIRTLREWNIRIDEAIFLGGLNKTEFLKAFGADFFFDDQKIHCDSAKNKIATGHVKHGITNQPKHEGQP